MEDQIRQLISDRIPNAIKTMRLVDATVGDLIPVFTEICQIANINPTPAKLLVEDELSYSFADAKKIMACSPQHFSFILKDREIRVQGRGQNRTIALGELKKFPNFKEKYEAFLISKQSNKVA